MPTLQTANDLERQVAVAALLEQRWQWELHSFGDLNPVDWWAEQDNRIKAFLELKVRTYSRDDFGDVWFAMRKWLALTMTASAFGVQGIFVVQFTDALLWIDIADVSGHPDTIKIGIGERRGRGLPNDREPVIHVPIVFMEEVT